MAYVYLSLLKDLVCSPRPYAPPVTRLSTEQTISSSVPRLISNLAIGNHHLEYGFPSTHSANSVSMALFLGTHLYDLHRAGSLSTAALATWVVVLVLYVSSIVGGRPYMGMHSFLDVFFGITLGIAGWVLQHIVMPEVKRWVTNSGWSGTSFISTKTSSPYSSISSQLFDCDASLRPLCQPTSVAHRRHRIYTRPPWHNHELLVLLARARPRHGPLHLRNAQRSVRLSRSGHDLGALALLKLTTGILVVLSWRILAKPIVHTLLL